MEHLKKLSPALYVLIILSFLLPFINLSCSGQKVMSLTGLQMVTGTQYEQKGMFGEHKQERVESEPLALLALLSAIVGLVIASMKRKNFNLANILTPLAGAIFLLLLMNKLNIDATAKGQGMITIDFVFGFWFTLLLFISSGVIHGLIYYNLKINRVSNLDEPLRNHITSSNTDPQNNPPPQTIGTPIHQASNFDILVWAKKNRKQVTIGSVGIFAILVLIFILNSTIWSTEQKVQKYIDDGLYEQARIILDNEIQKNPDNENLYFLYGKYYLATDNLSNAKQSFEQSARINSSIVSKISDAYLHEAEKSIQTKNSYRANNFFALCVKYDPNEKDKVVKKLVNEIEENLKRNNLSDAYSYSQTAISFDPNSSQTISKKAFEIAKSLNGSSQNASNIISLADFSNSYNSSLQTEWSYLLKNFLDKNIKSLDTYTLSNFCQKIAQWNSSFKTEMSNVVFTEAKNEINISEYDVNKIQSLLNSALAINSDLNSEASTLVWNKLSSSLSDLKALGQSRFLSLYNLCESYGLNSSIKSSDNYQFAFALKNYLEGNKAEAFQIFSSLSKKPNTYVGKMSSKIMSPPSVGTINFNSTPYLFKGTWTYFGGSGLTITLKSAKMTNSSIILTFHMKNNGTTKDCLIYAPKNIYQRFGSNCEQLYIMDDNGKKFYSYNGWQGTKHDEFNSCTQKICFNPNEEINLYAEFPMISAGATSIKFVSPNPDNAGHQSEWWWDNIKLKDGPFD